jgi:hypothetical protein
MLKSNPETYYRQLSKGKLQNGIEYTVSQFGRMRYSLLVKWGRELGQMSSIGISCGKKDLGKMVGFYLNDYR